MSSSSLARSPTLRPPRRPTATPPTPSDSRVCSPAGRSSFAAPPLPSLPLPQQTPDLCTPANPAATVTPPSAFRRDSFVVPASADLVKLAEGSGVCVYRVDRSPEHGVPRSPWVIKKAEVSPLLVRERRRVERILEHESRLLSKMNHPHIVGFRAAQRLPDGQVCLALEACDTSLYALIQERSFAEVGSSRPALFSCDEVLRVGRAVAAGLAYLHEEHHLLHGDIKSANVLVSRDLEAVKVCDLGVSLPLAPDRAYVLLPDLHHYEGNNTDLGTACGKLHRVGVLAITNPGDSDILRIIEPAQ